MSDDSLQYATTMYERLTAEICRRMGQHDFLVMDRPVPDPISGPGIEDWQRCRTCMVAAPVIREAEPETKGGA